MKLGAIRERLLQSLLQPVKIDYQSGSYLIRLFTCENRGDVNIIKLVGKVCCGGQSSRSLCSQSEVRVRVECSEGHSGGGQH